MQSPKTLYSPLAKSPDQAARHRHRALRHRLRARPLSVAQSVARRVLRARGVRPRRARDRRSAVDAERRHRARSPQRQADRRTSSRSFRSPTQSKAQLIALYEGKTDPLAGKSVDEKLALLKKTSYRDYLIKICGCSEEVANCFQGRTLDFYALGGDAVSAADAREAGYPGFGGLGLPDTANPELNEPYIHHFPDGNASIARLLVRSLIPAVARGRTMDDVVLARVRLLQARRRATRRCASGSTAPA